MSDAEDIFPALEAQEKGASICTLEELEERYWNNVAPDMRADGLNPDRDRPTHEWLSEHGHRDLIYALSTYHDTTFATFWREQLGFEEQQQGYGWDIAHEKTIDSFETYLDRRRGSKWDERTVVTHRSRLNRYAQAYYEVNGEQDLLEPVDPEGDVQTYVADDACWDAFDRLDDHYARSTLERIYRTVEGWYDFLIDRNRATTNPATSVGKNYTWVQNGGSTPSNQALSAAQVTALYEAAQTNEERTLIVALCAWGLRTNEVASLHRDQLQLDAEEPYVEFEDRKNGPGTVNVVYGAHDAQIRVSLLRDDEWNGYLFPSMRSSTGHIHRNTIVDRFKSIAERAGVTTDGDELPSPKMGRRFWYEAYSETISGLFEHVEDIAEEQGSSSASVVWSNYLSEERRRSLRRELMAERLEAAFEGVA